MGRIGTEYFTCRCSPVSGTELSHYPGGATFMHDTSGPKDVPGKPHENTSELDTDFYRQLLLQRRAQAERGISAIKERTFSAPMEDNISEDTGYDQHSADLAAETFEREKDLGLKDGLEIEIARIDGALERIRSGTYGLCLRCGRPISEGRLRAVPEAELCIDCQKSQETAPASRRPIEEQVLKVVIPMTENIDEKLYRPKPGDPQG